MTACGEPAPARLYDALADWWPLLSPPEEYGEEADDLRARFGALPAAATYLELGSGGGSLASHLKRHFRSATLTDRSPAMLAVSRAVNPDCEHLEGDMRTLRLGRTFDVVLIHDAICYMATPADLRAAFATAAAHCRPGGVVAIQPDYVRETYADGIDAGGYDGRDGRGLRYLEWRSDPDPADDTYVVDFAFLLRAPDGRVAAEHDRHVEGLFARADWLRWLAEAGLAAECYRDPWGRDAFVARRLAAGKEGTS